MKEDILTLLAQSTRSPKGRYDAAHTWKKLQERMHPTHTLHNWYNRAAGIAALLALATGVWAFCFFVVPAFHASPVEQPAEQAGTPAAEVMPKPLVFQDLPLQQIAQRLERTYGTPIQVEGEKLKAFRVTATFQSQEKLTDILEILRQTAHCSIKKNGKTIILYLP